MSNDRNQDPLTLLVGERSLHRLNYEGELGERDSRLGIHHDQLGPGSKAWKLLEEERGRAQAQFDAIGGVLSRPLQRLTFGTLLFVVLSLGLAGLEAPVNQFIFEAALGASTAASFVVSFFAAIALLAIAHTSGRLLRQMRGQHERKLYLSNLVLASVSLVMLAGLVMVLTVGRAEFSAGALKNGVGDIFSGVGDKISDAGLVAVIAHALGDTSAQILAALNIASLLMTFLLGFLAHDPDRNFDKAYERLEAAKSGLKKLDRKYGAACASEVDRASDALDNLDHKFSAANAAIVSIKAQRGVALDPDDNFVLSSLDRRLAMVRDRAYGARQETPPPSPAPPPSSQGGAAVSLTRIGGR